MIKKSNKISYENLADRCKNSTKNSLPSFCLYSWSFLRASLVFSCSIIVCSTSFLQLKKKKIKLLTAWPETQRVKTDVLITDTGQRFQLNQYRQHKPDFFSFFGLFLQMLLHHLFGLWTKLLLNFYPFILVKLFYLLNLCTKSYSVTIQMKLLAKF